MRLRSRDNFRLGGNPEVTAIISPLVASSHSPSRAREVGVPLLSTFSLLLWIPRFFGQATGGLWALV
jgi:hypothetical protein